MATSLLLRSLSRRVLHSNTSAIFTLRCLTANVKKQWAATSPLDKSLMSLTSRPFSSKPAGDVVLTELEDATKLQARINPLKAILDQSKCRPFDFKIVEAPGGDAWVEVKDDKRVLRFTLSQIGPFCFTTLKKGKELESGTTLSKAVMVVPSYYNDDQKDAAKGAATIAGFDVLKIITNESSEDEFPYEIIKAKECRHLAILDLSRGYFDIDIEEIIPIGDVSKMLETIVCEIKRIHGKDIRNYPLAFQRIEEEVEKARVDLSTFPDSKSIIAKLKGSFEGKLISLTFELSK